MENVIGPAFKTATGYTLNGTPGGSIGLANEIKSKLVRSDVFISAVPSVNASLEGSSNGGFVSWYSPLATAPLVIGYNPSSKFAAALKTQPWYKVLAEPGFKLGRTDPAVDPKGALTLKLVQQEAAALNQPNLVSMILGTTENPAQVFPEETLVARLLTGQLDAGFFFSNEAALAKIPTIKTGLSLGASFTITILKGAPHRAAAEAFVKFLYSKQGQSLMKGLDLNTEAPAVVGNTSEVPKGLSSIL
ncbi:MAG: extracellular solute-binding protein [Acidimicrobiaceae bacterium]|nr:extracellular solute-binding protein [Acidimicrobiaceae bacterium]